MWHSGHSYSRYLIVLGDRGVDHIRIVECVGWNCRRFRRDVEGGGGGGRCDGHYGCQQSSEGFHSSEWCGSVVGRLGGIVPYLVAGFAETAFAVLVVLKGLDKFFMVEIGPEHVCEI